MQYETMISTNLFPALPTVKEHVLALGVVMLILVFVQSNSNVVLGHLNHMFAG